MDHHGINEWWYDETTEKEIRSERDHVDNLIIAINAWAQSLRQLAMVVALRNVVMHCPQQHIPALLKMVRANYTSRRKQTSCWDRSRLVYMVYSRRRCRRRRRLASICWPPPCPSTLLPSSSYHLHSSRSHLFVNTHLFLLFSLSFSPFLLCFFILLFSALIEYHQYLPHSFITTAHHRTSFDAPTVDDTRSFIYSH